MGPVTRSSQNRRPLASSPPEQTKQEEAMPDDRMSYSEEPDDGDDENSENDEDPFAADDDEDERPPFALNSSTAQDLLQPLQQTADRVSRQVEEFAKCIDKFNTSRESSDQQLWEDALGIIVKYKEIAYARKERTASKSPRSRSSSRNRRSVGDTKGELQKLGLEGDLWALAHHVLICNSPDSHTQASNCAESALGDLHRYSSPQDIWNAFLNSDIAGQEYEGILAWLQETAASSSTSIDDALAELNARAERGEGIWSAGYLYTKNAIKAQKRARSWPEPLDPTNPGLTNSHTRAADSKPLITQMDPDAQTREGHVLQPQDDFHEQYAWQACWELLRRGETQESVRRWWTERKEIWRAVSLRSAFPQAKDQEPSPFYRIMNLAKNDEWRKRCKQLCEDGEDLYTYQSAVYGILCGDTKPVAEACKTIDDSLFSIFNAMLIARYRHYLSVYHRKLQDSSKSSYHSPQANWEQVRRFLALCQSDEKTRKESHEPHRAIEAAIVSQNFDDFFVRTGQAAAQVGHMTSESAHLMAKDDSTPSDECAQVTAGDFDSVRMVVHLQLILRALGYLEEPYAQQLYVVENNIANYIGWLERENKWAIIPLYASRLSASRAAHVLGAILIQVIDARERDLQVKLMRKYGIDVPSVLWGIFSLTNFNQLQRLSKGGMLFNPTKITEYTGITKVKHVKIRSRFIGEEIDNEDERAVRSIEWFRYADAENWGRACWAAAALYMTFLYEGRLAAASALAERASLTDISLAALNMNLNIAEASDDEDVDMDGLAQEEERKPISPTRRRKQPQQHKLLLPGTNRDQLASKSLVWVQLEQLVIVLNAFERWNDMANEVEENRNNPIRLRTLKKELLLILDAIRETMYPILSPSYLCSPNDEAEGHILRELRNHYLPECILAYNSALYFAGHALSRSWLVECMNLAQVVAGNPTLTEAFVEGKRMRELTTAFALDSQALLHANEAGGKKGKRDAGIDVWQVKGFTKREPLDLGALE